MNFFNFNLETANLLLIKNEWNAFRAKNQWFIYFKKS